MIFPVMLFFFGVLEAIHLQNLKSTANFFFKLTPLSISRNSEKDYIFFEYVNFFSSLFQFLFFLASLMTMKTYIIINFFCFLKFTYLYCLLLFIYLFKNEQNEFQTRFTIVIFVSKTNRIRKREMKPIQRSLVTGLCK